VVLAWPVLTPYSNSLNVQERTQFYQACSPHLQRTLCALTIAVYKSWTDVFLQAALKAADSAISTVVGSPFQCSGNCDFWGAPEGRFIYIIPPGVRTFVHTDNRMTGVTIYLGTNVRGGNLICARISRVVIWYVHECLALSKIACERMSVWTNVRDSYQPTSTK